MESPAKLGGPLLLEAAPLRLAQSEISEIFPLVGRPPARRSDARTEGAVRHASEPLSFRALGKTDWMTFTG